jgi:integrase
MPALPTTENAIRGLKPPSGRYQQIYRDAAVRGLGLRVGVKAKTWIVDHQDAAGKRRLSTLGQFPAMGVREARAAAQAVIGGGALGIDLVGERDQRAAQKRQDAAETLRHWWDRYDREHIAHLRENSRRSLRNAVSDLLDVAGDVPVTLVTPNHVRDAIEHRRARGATKSVFHARNSAVGFFKWLIEREVIQFNPASAVRSPKRNRGQRVLTDAELQDLLMLMAKGAVPPNARDVIHFCILTGRRIGEVVGLKFEMVDFAGSTMVVEEEGDKLGVERLYPLSADALAIIRRRRQQTNGDFVFQGVRSGAAPTRSLASIPLRRLLKGGAWKHRPFTLHDLRRTFRTTASRLGVRFEVAELLIGHALTGIHAVYDRHSYLDEMKTADDLIAAHVRKLAPKGEIA